MGFYCVKKVRLCERDLEGVDFGHPDVVLPAWSICYRDLQPLRDEVGIIFGGHSNDDCGRCAYPLAHSV